LQYISTQCWYLSIITITTTTIIIIIYSKYNSQCLSCLTVWVCHSCDAKKIEIKFSRW
jgi:hypothetical protein